MADYLTNTWNDLLELLKNNQQEILKNPLVWIVIGLMIVGIYGLYDVPRKTSANSLGNVIRKLVQTLLDTTTDVINALGSLTGFLKVLENLLFGNLNKKTLFILNNYAIIFLSMASFATTFSGLNIVLNWVLAAFISFGIQVSILVFCILISRYIRDIKKLSQKKKSIQQANHKDNFEETEGKNRKIRKVIRVSYKRSIPTDDYIRKGKLNINGNAKNLHEIIQREKNANENPKKAASKDVIWIKGAACAGIAILLMASVVISSSFSYLFMFEKFVNDQLAYDDHYRSIQTVHGIIRDYSKELSIYEAGLVDILSTYNDKVSKWMRLQENSPLILQEEIAQKNAELDELYNQRRDLETERILADDDTDDTEEQVRIEVELKDINNKIEAAEENLNTLEHQEGDSIYQNRLAAYEKNIELRRFYANPLYIREPDRNGILEAFSELFEIEIQYQKDESITRETEHLEFTDKQRNQVRDAFNMYYVLSGYYADHDSVGVDFEAVEGQLNIDYLLAEAKDYADKTNELLADMLNDLNAIPLLDSVASPWSGEIILVPNQEAYLAELYNLYRDSSGTVTIFERAFNKLFGRNNEKATLARELAFLAISFDLLIVWMTLSRGKKRYVTELGDLRRLVGVLILDDSLEEENRSYRKSQGFFSTLGIVCGILIFLLFRINDANVTANGQNDIVIFLICCVLGFIAGLLLHKIYMYVFHYRKKWDADILYLLWKQIWINSGKSEKELAKHINQLKENSDYKTVQISEEGIKTLESLCTDTRQQKVFTKYIYQDVLNMFTDIEMMKLYKVLMIKEIYKKQLIGVDYVSEQIFMPCIKESAVEEHNLQIQFSILMSRHLIEFDEGYFILTERFWNILYDAILLCIVGGRISDHDIEEELESNGEDEEEFY